MVGLESFLSCGGETRAGGPSVRASCSCLASLVVCVPEAGASQVTCWRSRTRTVTVVKKSVADDRLTTKTKRFSSSSTACSNLRSPST